MNITSLFFIDTSMFTTFMLGRFKKRLDDDGEIVLRGPDPETGEKIIDRPILKDWNSGRGLLSRLSAHAAPFLDGKKAVFGNIHIEKQGVNAHTPWRIDDGEYAETHHRCMLCLVPSPTAWVYSGGEGAVLQVGAAMLINHRVLHSEVNLGPCATVRLVADVRRPDAP